jgi:hypothetical protein
MLQGQLGVRVLYSRYTHTSCTLEVRMVLQSLVVDLIHESE